MNGRQIYQSSKLHVYEHEGLEERLIMMDGGNTAYAVYREINEGRAEILLAEAQVQEVLKYDTTFTSLFSLEKKMTDHDSLILHSASVCRDGKAVLFSAPSGTGKSTQAELWRKYRGVRIINGDRNLLVKDKGGWQMRGWPVCGSSEICHNEAYPAAAIVMLEQAAYDRSSELTGMAAYRKLFPEVTVSRWNKERLIYNMDLIEQLIQEVPVFRLECRIGESAVEVLERQLLKSGCL
ncbi:MAG: hypothetical protein IKD69_04425 [Solobacterium sp.]|nr:hypothetical protein [Solobacterium sp.]